MTGRILTLCLVIPAVSGLTSGCGPTAQEIAEAKRAAERAAETASTKSKAAAERKLADVQDQSFVMPPWFRQGYEVKEVTAFGVGNGNYTVVSRHLEPMGWVFFVLCSAFSSVLYTFFVPDYDYNGRPKADFRSNITAWSFLLNSIMSVIFSALLLGLFCLISLVVEATSEFLWSGQRWHPGFVLYVLLCLGSVTSLFMGVLLMIYEVLGWSKSSRGRNTGLGSPDCQRSQPSSFRRRLVRRLIQVLFASLMGVIGKELGGVIWAACCFAGGCVLDELMIYYTSIGIALVDSD